MIAKQLPTTVIKNTAYNHSYRSTYNKDGQRMHTTWRLSSLWDMIWFHRNVTCSEKQLSLAHVTKNIQYQELKQTGCSWHAVFMSKNSKSRFYWSARTLYKRSVLHRVSKKQAKLFLL